MTAHIDSGMMSPILQGGPAGPVDPDLNTGAGYWAAFTHDFPGSSLDTGIWSSFGTITVTANEARIPTTAYMGINTIATLNITDSSVALKVNFAAAAGGQQRAYVQLRSAGDDTRNINIEIDDVALTWIIDAAGSAISTTTWATGAYNATTMAYWRFKHRTARSQIIVESSPDNAVWTERASGAVPSGYNLTAADLQIGSYDGGTGYVAVAEVNV